MVTNIDTTTPTHWPFQQIPFGQRGHAPNMLKKQKANDLVCLLNEFFYKMVGTETIPKSKKK